MGLALAGWAGAVPERGGAVYRYGFFSRSPHSASTHAKTGKQVLLLRFYAHLVGSSGDRNHVWNVV